jgi:PAS domain S-box-containing protein
MTANLLRDLETRLKSVLAKSQKLEHERQNLCALSQTAALVNSSLELDPVLNEVIDTIIQITGAERGYLMLRNEASGELEFRVARNMDEQELADKDAHTVSRSIIRRVEETGEAVLTTNAQEDERFQAAQSILSYRLRSVLCVPLRVRDQVIGAIYADNKLHSGQFDESTRDLLQAFSHQAGVAVENARLFTRLRATLDAISEMKKLQDDIFASITSGVLTADEDGKVTLLSPPAREILAVETGEAVGGELHAILPLLGERFEAMLEQVRETGEVFSGIEFETEIAGRGEAHLSVSMSPLIDAHNEAQGVAIVVDDQSEAKRREAQLKGVRRYLPSEVVDGLRTAQDLRLGGTRQVITILFGDIRGFSSFSERLDPEKLVEIINSYLTLASHAIHDHNGIIDKYMGDAVMALYNTPLRPQEDHALRAVRSAAQMVEDIRAHHARVPSDDRLAFGIGVHTGEAVVGNVGSPERLDYTAMGDSVNLAKRLQEVAKGMTVLLSDATYERIEGAVEVKELAPIQVKGRTQLTRVFELLDVQEETGR